MSEKIQNYLNEIKKIKIITIFFLFAFCLLFGIVISNFDKRKKYNYVLSISNNQDSLFKINEDQFPKSLKPKIKILKSESFINSGNYIQALKLNEGETAIGYYNRGTIRLLLAYNDALKNDVNSLVGSEDIVKQAINDFDIAQKINLDKSLEQKIKDNQLLAQEIGVLVGVKNCYGQGGNIIDSLRSFSKNIDDINETVKQESEYLAKNKKFINQNFDENCFDKLNKITDTSKVQLKILQKNINDYENKYKTDLSYKLYDPSLCLSDPFDNILISLQDGKQGIQEFGYNHQNSLSALKNKDYDLIKLMCEQTKNDSQINEKIDNSLKQLFKSLDQNINKKKEDQSDNVQQSGRSNNINYKNIYDQKEQDLLDQSEEKNNKRIKEMQDIKSKSNYDSELYLQDLFQEFYGNSGDFKNLK
ncbi:MAG: hypothetical protein WC872_00035 [Candidatus Absconditabacterales bacterium]